MAKLKVMQMIGAAKPGGAETFAVRLFIALAKHKNIDLMVLARNGSWVARLLKDAGVNVKEVPFGGIFDFRTKWLALCAAREFQPKVIQSWMNRATRFVPKGPWATVGRLGGFYDLKYYRNRVVNLVGNTPDICTYCIGEGWAKDKVSFISNFIPKPEKGWKDARAAYRKKLGVGEGTMVLLMAGRLHKNKGVDVAIEALAKLPDSCELVLMGEGPLRKEMLALAGVLKVDGRVHFIGWQDRVSPWAAAADIWLAPSRHEPLGNTVLDGWVHEIPVVAANTGGLAMLVDDKKTGLLVDVDDAAGLAKAVKLLMKDEALRKAVVKGGMARFDKEYSEDVIVGQYVAYYENLARGAK